MNREQKLSTLLNALVHVAREEGDAAATVPRDQDAGEVMAWYRVLEVLRDEAAGLGLDLDELGLGDLDPAVLLEKASRRKAA